jgi:hypothetical protein
MEYLKINQFEVDRRAGQKRGATRDMLVGRKKTTSDDKLSAVAKALECDLEYLTGHQETPRRIPGDEEQGMPIRVICETGVWRPVKLGGTVSGSIPMRPDPRFRNVRNSAGLARGNGADLAGIEDGEHFVYLNWEDWTAQGLGAVKTGALYVVQRERQKWEEIEHSLRVARVDGETIYFEAPSSEDYVDAVSPPMEGERLAIVGIVVSSIHFFM